MSGPTALSSMVLRAAQRGAGGTAVLLTGWQDSRTAEDIQTGRIYRWPRKDTGRQSSDMSDCRVVSMLQARQKDMPVILKENFRALCTYIYLNTEGKRNINMCRIRLYAILC
jgi:hypothetical protein